MTEMDLGACYLTDIVNNKEYYRVYTKFHELLRLQGINYYVVELRTRLSTKELQNLLNYLYLVDLFRN